MCEESDDSPIDFDDEEFEDPNSIEVHDFVLVRFATKKTLKFFVGQIIEITECECLINFLKITENQTFVFPQIKDESYMPKDDIIFKLPTPNNKGGTVRAASIYKFNVSFGGYNIG